MPPWRDIALSVELGDRVTAEMMTLADWMNVIRRMYQGLVVV